MEALHESEARYHQLFDTVPVGLYRTTPDGRILDANPALAEMLGYPDRQTLLAVNVVGIYLNPEDRHREQALFDRSDIVENIELQLRRYDGSAIWVRDTVRSIRGADGRVLYFDGSLEEITERKTAEEARSLLASIVESSDDAIIGMSLDGIIVSWNSGAERIFGYGAEEIKGHSILFLAPSERIDELPQILERMQQGKRVEHLKTVQLKKDGHPIDVALALSSIKDATGRIMGISMITRDITQQMQMERYVLNTERLAAMGRISAVLAHEVKNRSQALVSNLELLKDFPLDPDESENCLQLCCREVERLVEITQRMLIFARTERQTVHPISIFQAWDQALNFLKKTLEKTGIQVIADLPDELPELQGVADQINQVMVNLMLNSIEAMPNGGLLQASAIVEGARLVFILENNGPSIPQDHLKHLFDPFFTTKPEGSGLGLFISHNIVQQHSGTLSVENRKDEPGVIYTLTLPINLIEDSAGEPSDTMISPLMTAVHDR